MFIINHVVFTISLGTVSQIYQLGEGGDTAKSPVGGRAGVGGSNLSSGPSQGQQPQACCVNPFLTGHMKVMFFHFIVCHGNFLYYAMPLKTMVLTIV